MQQCNNGDVSHRYNSKVEKPDTKENMLCDSMYVKFKNTEKVVCSLGNLETSNLDKWLWLKGTWGRFQKARCSLFLDRSWTQGLPLWVHSLRQDTSLVHLLRLLPGLHPSCTRLPVDFWAQVRCQKAGHGCFSPVAIMVLGDTPWKCGGFVLYGVNLDPRRETDRCRFPTSPSLDFWEAWFLFAKLPGNFCVWQSTPAKRPPVFLGALWSSCVAVTCVRSIPCILLCFSSPFSPLPNHPQFAPTKSSPGTISSSQALLSRGPELRHGVGLSISKDSLSSHVPDLY